PPARPRPLAALLDARRAPPSPLAPPTRLATRPRARAARVQSIELTATALHSRQPRTANAGRPEPERSIQALWREDCECVVVPSGAVVRLVPVLFARDSARG